MAVTPGVQDSSQYSAQLQSSRQSPDQSQKKCDSRVQKIIHYTKENLPELACKVAYVVGVVLFAIGLMKSSVALMTVGGAFFGTAIISTMIHRYIKAHAIDKHAKELFDATEAFSKINEYDSENYNQAENNYRRARTMVEKDLVSAAPRDLIKYITRLSKACPNKDFEINAADNRYDIPCSENRHCLQSRNFVQKIIYSKLDRLIEDYNRDMHELVNAIDDSFFEDKNAHADVMRVDPNKLKIALRQAAADLANSSQYKVLDQSFEKILKDICNDLLTFDAVKNYGTEGFYFLFNIYA
ncbi:MAG: hypothetical protein WCT85_02800 [Parachlamydiales bacterium]|jgi:hypothetical protein